MQHKVVIQIGKTQIPLEFDPTREEITRILSEILPILKVGFEEEALRHLHYKKVKEAFNAAIEINFDGYAKVYKVLIREDNFVEMEDNIKKELSSIKSDVECELLYSTLRKPLPIIKLAN